MWIFAAVVLLFTGGVTCVDRACLRRTYKECDFDRMPDVFPQTAEELETGCHIFLDVITCVLRIHLECDSDERDIKFISNAVEFLNKECNPDRELFKAISRDLGCLEEKLSPISEACYLKDITERRKEVATTYQLTLEERGFNTSDSETSECVLGIWMTSCTVMKLREDCGQEIADASLQFFLKLERSLTACPEELISEVPAFIEVLSLAKDIEEEIENEARKKK